MRSRPLFLLAIAAALTGCGTPRATPTDAKAFIDDAEQKLLPVNIDSGRADWVKSTYITDDTEDILRPSSIERAIAAQVELCQAVHALRRLKLARDLRARCSCSNLASPSPRRRDPREARGASRASPPAWRATYGKGKWCPDGPASCMDIEDLTKLMANSRDAEELRTPGPAGTRSRRRMRKDFARFVELSNKGARELGFQGYRRDVALEIRYACRTISPRSWTGCGSR